MNLQQLQTPIAIIVAGIFVAIAIIFSGNGADAEKLRNVEGEAFGNNNSGSAESVRAVSEIDHIFGSSDAKVVIIEYSDFECPFCSRAHPTFEKAVQEYEGEVAWVYRHFPLTSIHSRAQRASVASECVAELSGNDAFWKYTDILFKKQRSLGDELYISEAVALGVDESAFTECLNSTKYDAKIASDMQNAIDSGGRGTPFSVVINSKGETFPFAGALPYAQVKSIIDSALSSS